MEPKHEGLEDDFPFQTGDFQVNHVSFRGSAGSNQLMVNMLIVGLGQKVVWIPGIPHSLGAYGCFIFTLKCDAREPSKNGQTI